MDEWTTDRLGQAAETVNSWNCETEAANQLLSQVRSPSHITLSRLNKTLNEQISVNCSKQ